MSFADKHTKTVYEIKRFQGFHAQAERKLQLLDSAVTLDFLRNPARQSA